MTEFVWTKDRLDALEERRGFRLRGAQMSRLETFTDAAFAFAVTLLVISVDDVPQSWEEFMTAMEVVPAFVMCFTQLMLFWWGHHVWSRRYGLEGGWDIVFSLTFVAIVLVYIYPLRVMFSAFLYNATGQSVGTSFVVETDQVGQMFWIFGVFFTLLSGVLVLHFARAYSLREYLQLNAREIVETRGEIFSWTVVCLTGLVSALLTQILPDDKAPTAAYVYYSLAITMPLVGWRISRERRAIYA